jgi:hypothetical protein
MRSSLLVPLIGALLCGSTPAAQEALEPPRAPGWIFTPAFSVGGTWDDNVLLVFREETIPKDYGSALNPSFDLDFTGRQTQLSVGYDGSFVLYRTVTELNSVEQTGSVAFEHQPNKRVTVFASEAFNLAPTTDALNMGGIPFYRVGSQSNTAGGGVEASLARHTTMRTAYTLNVVDFDFDDVAGQQLRGGYSHLLEFGLSQVLSPRLSLGGEYSFQRAVVAGRIDRPEFPDERFSIHNALGTVTYQISPTLTISGGVGVARLRASQTLRPQTGPALRAGITHRGRRAVVTASYHRSFVPSYGFGGTFQNEEWLGSVLVPFARNRVYLDGSVAYLNNEALQLLQPSLRSLWYSTKVGYRATRWLSVEGFYNRVSQEAEFARGNLSRNVIGFQVVTSKPMKLR